MKTIAATFLILIALFCGGCSLLGLSAGAASSGFGWVIGSGLMIAVLAGLGAAALLFPTPPELPMPPPSTPKKDQTPPDPDMWR